VVVVSCCKVLSNVSNVDVVLMAVGGGSVVIQEPIQSCSFRPIRKFVNCDQLEGFVSCTFSHIRTRQEICSSACNVRPWYVADNVLFVSIRPVVHD